MTRLYKIGFTTTDSRVCAAQLAKLDRKPVLVLDGQCKSTGEAWAWTGDGWQRLLEGV